MARWLTRLGGCLFAPALLLMVASTAAQAMSWFAARTGQPYSACHVARPDASSRLLAGRSRSAATQDQ